MKDEKLKQFLREHYGFPPHQPNLKKRILKEIQKRSCETPSFLEFGNLKWKSIYFLLFVFFSGGLYSVQLAEIPLLLPSHTLTNYPLDMTILLGTVQFIGHLIDQFYVEKKMRL
jgi:hypothetical protein